MPANARHAATAAPRHDGDKTIVILGAPRGGTSMVAGVIRELGVDLGARLGVNHEDPQFLPMDLSIIRQRIGERNATKGTWGWKMPHSTDYIDRIEKDLRNPHIIFVFRNVLGIALSQQRHSQAELGVALAFSMNRLEMMVEKIKTLSSPTLLVDYDNAVLDGPRFLDALTDFLGIEANAATRARALDFIDADKGYRQIAATYYHVSEAGLQAGTEIELTRNWRHLKKADSGRDLVRNGNNPGFIFAPRKSETLPKRLIFRFSNVTEVAQEIRFVFDYDGQFSRNMSQKVMVKPGSNSFLITTNGNARRICVIPAMVEDRSSVLGFRVYEAG